MDDPQTSLVARPLDAPPDGTPSPDTAMPRNPDVDAVLIWNSMDLPGMDRADGQE